jgi:hypothetical protein
MERQPTAVLPHGRTSFDPQVLLHSRRIGTGDPTGGRLRFWRQLDQLFDSIRRCCSMATSPEIIHRSRTRTGSGYVFISKGPLLSRVSAMSTACFQQHCDTLKTTTYTAPPVGNL